MSAYKPYSKTAEYEELRDKVDRLTQLGFKIQKLIDATGVQYNAVYDWLKRRRNLNHENAQKIQDYLVKLKQEVDEIIE